MKTRMRIPMTYTPTGEKLTWTVSRDRIWTGTSERDGWQFTDHDGYVRFGGWTWAELVDRFSASAEGYNLTHRLS